MRAYAQGTSVPVDRTRSEIESILTRHGATAMMVGSTAKSAMIAFEMRSRRLRFMLPLPEPSRKMTENQLKAEVRRRWRALLLVLKAKLEAVSSSIVAFDVEFLPFIVVRGSETVADQLVPQIGEWSLTEKLPPLLGTGAP